VTCPWSTSIPIWINKLFEGSSAARPLRRDRESSAFSPPRTEALLNRAKEGSDAGWSLWIESSNSIDLAQRARPHIVPAQFVLRQ
jgi:hypothetical protein